MAMRSFRRLAGQGKKENGGARGPAVPMMRRSKDQPSSLRTAWFDWLASDRAVVESDCRVCRANRLAPSWLVSASTRLSEPVCKSATRFLVKSLRVCTVDRVEPNAEAWVRSVVNAVFRPVSVVSTLWLSWKPVPEIADSPRPVESDFTPLMVSELEPVSLNLTVV